GTSASVPCLGLSVVRRNRADWRRCAARWHAGSRPRQRCRGACAARRWAGGARNRRESTGERKSRKPASGNTATGSLMAARGRLHMTRHLGAAAAFLIAVGGLGLSSTLLERRAAAQAKSAVQAPRFEVDPLWPKPLPNKWILGQTIG